MKAGTLPYFNNVLKELINIKKYATPEEFNNLNFNTLQTTNGYNCIYGQMIGHCHYSRAKELIRLCCKTKTSFTGIFGDIIHIPPRQGSNHFLSYLEHCIVNYPNNNSDIIKFLKSEINTITLTSK